MSLLVLRPILRIGPFQEQASHTEMGQPVSRWDNCKKIFHHSNTYRRLCSLSFIVNSQLNSIRPSYMYMANVSFRYIYLSNKERWNKEYIFWKVFRVRPNRQPASYWQSLLRLRICMLLHSVKFTWLRFCIFNRHMLILALYLVLVRYNCSPSTVSANQ